MTCQSTLQSTVPPKFIVYHHLKGRPAEPQQNMTDALSFAKENITIFDIEAYPDNENLQIKVEKITFRLAKWYTRSSTV